MNTKRIILILIGVIFISFGIGFLSLGSKRYEITNEKDKGFSLDFMSTTKTYNLDEEFTATLDDIRKISITAPMAKVNIIAEDRNDVYVHYHGYISDNIKTSLDCKKFDKRLEIEANNKNFTKVNIGNFKSLEIILDVYVPNTYSEDINIKANLGDINISDFNLDELEINAELGNIKVSNINAEEIDIEANLGNVNMENIHADKVEIDCDSGNIVAKNIKGDTRAQANLGNIELDYGDFDYELNAVSNLGSITIILPQSSNFNLDAKSNLGSVKTDFPVTTTETSNNKLRGTVGNGGKDVKLTVDLGNINIRSK